MKRTGKPSYSSAGAIAFSSDHVLPSPELFHDIEKKLEAFPVHLFAVGHDFVQRHAHRFVELVYVCKGRGIHVHYDRKYPIRVGDCFIVLPLEPHGYERGEGLAIINIMFRPEALSAHIGELERIDGFKQYVAIEPFFRSETAFRYKLHLSSMQNACVRQLVERMYVEQRDEPSGSEAVRSGLFIQLMAMLGRFFGENLLSSADGHLHDEFAVKQEMVEKALAYLEEHFSEVLSVHEVALHVCLSVSYFSHLFKEKTGMSLMDYLLGLRMDNARNLLKNKEKNITEIAFEVGFHDSAYFSRMFKRHFGVPPSKMRSSAV